MKFGMFFVAEFTHAFTVGALTATFFLGGWRGPWAETYPLLGMIYFIVKASVVYFIIILMRGTLPRMRIDQMLNFTWKFLTPLALADVIVTMLADKLVPVSLNFWAHAGALLLVNVLLVAAALGLYSATHRAPHRMPAAASQVES